MQFGRRLECKKNRTYPNSLIIWFNKSFNNLFDLGSGFVLVKYKVWRKLCDKKEKKKLSR